MPPPIPPAFGFASPWLLAGLGLAAVPVVIHLLFRRPYRDVPWAATRFVLQATRKHSRRLKFEQYLLLAVRVLGLALAALALARPFLQVPGSVAGARPASLYLLVIDTSYSMGRHDGSVNDASANSPTRLEQAQRAAVALIDAAPPGDAFLVVQMSDLSRGVLVGQPAYQSSQVASAVENLVPTAGRADPLTALRTARDLLRRSEGFSLRHAVIFSDFQRSDWRPAARRAAELRRAAADLARAATVRRVDVGTPNAGNGLVTGVEVDAPFIRRGVPVRLTAAVRQAGELAVNRPAVRPASLAELFVDGQLTATAPINPQALKEETVAFTHTFTELRPHAVEIRLPADRLPIDDRRFLAVTPRDRLRVLLVDGDSTGRRDQSATYYLSRALAPGRGSTTHLAEPPGEFEPVTVREGELASQSLADFDAVVLADVGLLTDREAKRLRTFAAAGGGVVIALGDRVRSEAYNRLFADAGADALLPVRLGERQGDPVRPQRAVRFDTSDLSHPIVRPFAGNAGTGLDTDFVLAYARAELVEPVRGHPAAIVPLRFDTGDPAILTAPLGSGRVVLLTTGVGPDWAGPWPQAGRSFLPLMHEIVRYAATGRSPAAVRVGTPFVWSTPDRLAGLTATVTGPDGATQTLSAVAGPEGLRVVVTDTAQPGVYTLTLPEPVGRTTAFAANVDPTEGDLASLTPAERDAFAAELDPAAEAPVAGGSVTDGSAGRWLLAAVLALLLAEPLLSWRPRLGAIVLLLIAFVFVVNAVAELQSATAAGMTGVAGVTVAAVALMILRRRAAVVRRSG